MYLDDNHRFMLGLYNQIHEAILKRNFIRAFAIFPLYKLMSIDIHLARLTQVLLYFAPLCFSVFYLMNRFFELPRILAFSVALIPGMIPGQMQIPLFIDGSYTIQGLLVFNCALIFLLMFATTTSDRKITTWMYYFCGLLTFISSFEMMDHAIFLLPVLLAVVFLIGTKRSFFTNCLLCGPFILAAIAKIFHLMMYPTVSSGIPTTPTWSEFWIRSLSFLYDSVFLAYVPFTSIKIPIFPLIILLLSICGLGLYFADRRNRYFVFALFGWVLFSALPFLTVARSYSPRYAHIASFGISAILLISIYQLLKFWIKPQKIITGCLLFLILVTGITHEIVQRKQYFSTNNENKKLGAFLKSKSLPSHSQIIITNYNYLPTGGWYNYSTGAIVFFTGDPTLSGVIGPEKSQYEVFNPLFTGFIEEHRMSGINSTRPIFLYRFTCQKPDPCQFQQKEYALNVIKEKNRFELYHFDPTSGIIQEKYDFDDLLAVDRKVTELTLAPQDLMFY